MCKGENMKTYINDGQKRNYYTGREYTGRNAAILAAADDVFFLTFVQGKELGYHLTAESQGVHLLLIDRREKTETEDGYFYKRGFVVFGLSCWTKNGTAISEPAPGAPFPWAEKSPSEHKPEKEKSEVFKDRKPKPDKPIREKTAPVNDKTIRRSEFLKSAAAFFPSSKELAYVSISGGRAVIMARPFKPGAWQCAVINDVHGDFVSVVEIKTARTIIKGIDNFKDGLIGNKRVCHQNTAGAAEFFEPEEFAALYIQSVNGPVSVPADKLRAVSYAAADDFVKPSFYSVCIAPGAFVASDSRRLAALQFETGVKDDLIIPLPLAKNALGTVSVSGNVCRADCAHGTLSTHLIDGQFPLWKKVIPSYENAAILPAPRSLWAELKSIAQAPSFKAVFRPDGCYVMDQDETGKSFERKVSAVSSPEAFGVNAAYMLDAVRENSTIYVTGALSPIVISTGDFLDVVMPIQIKPNDEEVQA